MFARRLASSLGSSARSFHATPAPAMAMRPWVGTVLSNRMQKTCVVAVDRIVQHKRTSKYIKQRTKVYAHDGQDLCNIGDKVEIEHIRPLSKLKRWNVTKILRRADI